MAYFKATIEILIDVSDESEACDAIAEALRPMLREFGGDSCFVDWRYHESNSVPAPSDGAGFEYSERPPAVGAER